MPLKQLLLEHRKGILQLWHDNIVATYPTDTNEYFKRQQNSFLNPVGASIQQQVESLFDYLTRESESTDADELAGILQEFIRIRAVQEFTPSKAVGFILMLKLSIREKVGVKIVEAGLLTELNEFDNSIDLVLLKAFDVYQEARTKIYELRANDLKRRSYLLDRWTDRQEAKREQLIESPEE